MAQLIEIQGLDEVVRKIRALGKKYPEITASVAAGVLEEVVGRMESETMALTPAGVGGAAGLRGSLFGEVRLSSKKMSGVWGTPLTYGEAVEQGRRPGKMPPVDPIILWVRRKLGVPEKEATGVGWAIAHKIQKHGTDGAYMFDNAWRGNKEWVQNKIASIPEKIVRRASGGV